MRERWPSIRFSIARALLRSRHLNLKINATEQQLHLTYIRQLGARKRRTCLKSLTQDLVAFDEARAETLASYILARVVSRDCKAATNF